MSGMNMVGRRVSLWESAGGTMLLVATVLIVIFGVGGLIAA